MKINRLKMTGYGQQKNKIIEVSDNLNIVLGSSPRAEQTVRDFIEAMFFGMTPEKRDVYRPESGSYEGEMLLETEDGRSRQATWILVCKLVLSDAESEQN